MNVASLPTTMAYWNERNARALVVIISVSVVVLFAGCGTVPASGQLAAPTFGTLEIPDLSGSSNWTTYSTSSPPPEVLPTRGRGLRLWFYAPANSSFAVSLRELDVDRTTTPLTRNNGVPSAPEAGYFQILSENRNHNPALYSMYLRAPLSLMDPANFDLLVVNQSLRNDVADGAPMVVPLRQRKVFTVTVMVTGSGRVTSTPPGIQCGVADTGSALTQCRYEFGPGSVSLAPKSLDSASTRFQGWKGNCPSSVQTCTLTLDGMGPVSASATFAPRSSSETASTCRTAPTLPGLRWVDIPGCAFGVKDEHPGITDPANCDSAGYFCCEPGSSTSNHPRCGGIVKIESPPDCRHLGVRGILRQPGGCYEVDAIL